MPIKEYKFLDKKARKQLFEALGLGLPVKTCCEFAGIHQQTYYSWLKKGETEIQDYEQQAERGEDTVLGPYGEFVREVGKLKAGLIMKYVKVIEEAATDPDEPCWKAAMEFLKSRFPDTWGKRVSESKLDVSGSVKVLAQHQHIATLSPGETVKLIINQACTVMGNDAGMFRGIIQSMISSDNPQGLQNRVMIRNLLEESMALPQPTVIEAQLVTRD